MAKLGYDPKSHYNPHKQDEARKTHERGLENKLREAVGRNAAFRSQLQYDLQHAQNRKARRNVTLAPCAFLKKPDPDTL